MEPWDGPAAVAFTDGKWIGATLDRNGLRPARYLVTKDGQLIMASETGVLPVKPEDVDVQGPPAARQDAAGESRRAPHRSRRGDQARAGHAAALRRMAEGRTRSRSMRCPSRRASTASIRKTIVQRQRAFGYTEEDLRILMTPMAAKGEEPIGSMGTDTPLACLSDRPQPLFNYFKQMFAQVTNPAIDPIREELVMSLTSYIGTERNILEETPQHCHTLKLPHPILTNLRSGKAAPRQLGRFPGHHAARRCSASADGEQELERALDGLCRRASLAIRDGYRC